MQLKLLLFFVVTCASYVQGDVNPRVAVSLVEIGNQTYYISDDGIANRSFHEAEQLCADLGLKLISFETPEEFTQVTDYHWSNPSSRFWTSGKKINELFFWTATNEPFTYGKFHFDHTDCYLIGQNSYVYFQGSSWFDVKDIAPFYHPMWYMCE